jgi:hypothetical protein
MIIQYWNSYQKQMRDWDTEKSGAYMTVSVGGDVLAMDETLEKGLARLAWYEVKNPNRVYKLWFGPCAFSDTRNWIAVEDHPSDRVRRTAQLFVNQMSGRNEDGSWKKNQDMMSFELDRNRRVYDKYKKVYKLSTQYF